MKRSVLIFRQQALQGVKSDAGAGALKLCYFTIGAALKPCYFTDTVGAALKLCYFTDTVCAALKLCYFTVCAALKL